MWRHLHTKQPLSLYDRLKVACRIWHEEKGPESEVKALHLLQWASNAVGLSKNSDECLVRDKLWEFIHLLFSQSSSILTEKPETINSVFIKAATRDLEFLRKSHLFILNCLNSVLHMKPLPAVMFKYELMLFLTTKTLKLARQLVLNNTDTTVVLLTTNQLMCHFFYLQQIHGNQKKVFLNVCEELLVPLLELRDALEKDEIIDNIDRIINWLFSRDHLSEYSSSLAAQWPPLPAKVRSNASYTRLLFQKVEQHLSADLGNKLFVDLIPRLLSAFIAQNRTEKKLSRVTEFQFFARMINLLGFHIDEKVDKQINDETTNGDNEVEEEEEAMEEDTEVLEEEEKGIHAVWNESIAHLQSLYQDIYHCEDAAVTDLRSNAASSSDRLHVLFKCLETMLHEGVYQIAEDNRAGGKQLRQLQALCRSILSRMNFVCLGECCQCLTVLFKINHQSLLPVLVNILTTLSAIPNFLRKDLPEAADFLEECIVIFSKLRQVPIFLKLLVRGLDQIRECDFVPQLSPALFLQAEKRLILVVQHMSGKQSITILEHLVDHLVSVYLPLCQNPPRKKKRKTSISNSVPLSLVHSLAKTVDVLSIVLLHVPLQTWHKEKAQSLLWTLWSNVCLGLMDAAATLMCLQPVSLRLYLSCCELHYRLANSFPDKVPTAGRGPVIFPLVWEDDLQPHPQCWAGAQVDFDNAMVDYLMRELALLYLKFERLQYFSVKEHHISSLVVYLLKIPTTTSSQLNIATWNGQFLGVTQKNHSLAAWSLIFYHLPLLSSYLLPDHWSTIADTIVTVLPYCTNGPNGGGMTDSVLFCLQAPWFQQLGVLHEYIVDVCLRHSASLLPESWIKELRSGLLSCCHDNEELNSLTTTLSIACKLLDPHCKFDELSKKRLIKLMSLFDSVQSYCKVLQAMPFSPSSISTILRTVVGVCHWCAAAVLTMRSMKKSAVMEEKERIVTVVADLHCLLAWLLHQLTRSLALVSKRSRSKKLQELDWMMMCESLLLWTCDGAYICLTRLSNTNTLLADKLQACFLLMAEKALELSIKTTSSTATSVEKSYASIQPFSDKSLNSVLILQQYCSRWLLLASKVSAKVLQDKSLPLSQHKEAGDLQDSVSLFCVKLGKTADAGSEELLILREPSLLTAFASSIDTNHRFIKDVRKLLIKSGSYKDLQLATSPLEQVLAVTASTVLMSSSPTQTWQHLASHLASITPHLRSSKNISLLTKIHPRSKLSAHIRTKQIHFDSCDNDLYSTAALVTSVMGLTLEAIEREQATEIFTNLFTLDGDSIGEMMCFCLCWELVLEARLQQKSRMELRQWLSKVVLRCVTMVTTTNASSSLVVTMAVKLIARILIIPHQVGLDSRSVVISLHSIGAVSVQHLWTSPQLFQAVYQLLSSIIHNHASVLVSSFAPFLATINKLVLAVVFTGQYLYESCEDRQENTITSKEGIEQAELLSRLLESLSKLPWFSKFSVYIAGPFITECQSKPLHMSIKRLLHAGFFNVVKLMTSADLSFLKASLDQEARDWLQDLLHEYNRFFKFSGKV